MRVLWFCWLMVCAVPAWAAHGYAMWDDLKYPPGFKAFDYVNVDAPKGGELRLVSNQRYSTFDKYNPFTIKGAPPAYLGSLMFDSLLAGSMDETASGYGLLAEDVVVSPDRLSATFRLRPEARFHDGTQVEAADVKHSYDTLIGPYVSPAYKTMLEDVESAEVVDARTIRYKFRKPNRELPLIVGGLPVFSRRWGMENGKAKPFDQVVMDIPIGSGPYKIGPVRFGKDITYVRDPAYWARDLAVRRGKNNFDRITIKIYKDNTARLEAFKAGEFDMMSFYSAGDWARRVTGKRFDTGELVKREFAHRLPSGFQSYVLNNRRPLLQDRRVREALGLAFDYDWMSRQMFYGGYPRVRDLFGNTDCAAEGTPSPEELKLLEPWRGKVPDEVFGPMYEPPTTEGAGHSLRNNLRRAQDLLKQAGWEYRDGALRDAQGRPMELEYLDSKEGGVRTVSPWMRNLEKLGITLKFASADFALYQQRLDKFEFDITTINFPGTHNPGQQLADIFGSKAATTESSGNYMGVSSPAVDALVTGIVRAETKAELLPACRALDRVIMHSHYLIPQWTLMVHRIAYNAWRLAYKAPMPPYASGEDWVMTTWWAR
ncbi:extracellular solute-binding protein [Variovorax sp. J22P240]|uniref:extracellular solute-binding protein n=1 Tax=unclassified Variovorax TaxID=663243 RepID=UPI0025759819|nr:MULTISPECIES: extracellular solute-binding protein [unclassified Variovorax]MDL9998016.1 extracellular solute-binding protein [Variovorax sp. J22P240]MDM0049329.1 extracellular solute-binding protein [Variovorax sp. J22R115]